MTWLIILDTFVLTFLLLAVLTHGLAHVGMDAALDQLEEDVDEILTPAPRKEPDGTR